MSTSLSTVQNKNPNNNKLPTEILLQIFSHVSGDDYRNRNLVKQVCKSWYDAAAYHYRGGYAKVVVINYHKNQIYSALLQHFSKNPHFRSKVKSLVMHDKYSGSSLKTKIKSLFLNDDFKRCGCVKTLLQLCPNLVELDFLEGDTATSR
jgi:RNase P protein component